MSPWTMTNPPSVAKNWSEDRKRKCVSAANAVLRESGSDREAIFACIHNARVKQTEEEYETLSEAAAQTLQGLVEAYYDGEIDEDEFEEKFQDELRSHYTLIMLASLGKSREVTPEDIVWINERLNQQFDYLKSFVEDISTGRMTQQRALWRAGLYGYPRAAWVNFSVPPNVADLMGVLPGDDCLGGGQCKCVLNIEQDDEGGMYVYWILDPIADHCAVCVAHALESPYYFTPEEVADSV